MEGKNIYLSVFPEFLGLLSFCLLKFTKNIDLQVMRVTMIFRITRLSLSTGWNKKIRITLSKVASSTAVMNFTSQNNLCFDSQALFICLYIYLFI